MCLVQLPLAILGSCAYTADEGLYPELDYVPGRIEGLGFDAVGLTGRQIESTSILVCPNVFCLCVRCV